MTEKQYTGIVLAGGKSSRMGADKGMIGFNGRTFAGQILDVLQQVAGRTMVIANKGVYQALGVPVHRDIISGCGPLGGIYTGLSWSGTGRNLVLGCDLPFVSADALRLLIAADSDAFDITVPVHRGRAEPLCAVYSKRCLPELERRAYSGEWKLMDLLKAARTNFFSLPGGPGMEISFMNINTPQDLINAKIIVG